MCWNRYARLWRPESWKHHDISIVRAELVESLFPTRPLKPFFVYMLRCADGSYYVGQTDDLQCRMQQHGDGLIGYTATRKPVELIWSGEFETREGAIAFERRIKGWSRAKKEALIRGDWPAIQQLARSRMNPPTVRPDSPITDRLGNPTTIRLGNPTTVRPGNPTTVRPGNPTTVRPELVEGRDAAQVQIAPRLRQAQPERLGDEQGGVQ